MKEKIHKPSGSSNTERGSITTEREDSYPSGLRPVKDSRVGTLVRYGGLRIPTPDGKVTALFAGQTFKVTGADQCTDFLGQPQTLLSIRNITAPHVRLRAWPEQLNPLRVSK